MDEPTAALDSKAENAIRDSIDKLISNKTVVMVTHRKALLSLMDIVFVMDEGMLHPVEKYGGLESYLKKIEDNEADDRQLAAAAATQKDTEQALARVEAQNQQLQEELNSLRQPQSTQVADGTLIVNH